MSADANLGQFVIEAPGFSKTSASELSGAPLASSEIESAAQSLAADLKAAGAASHEPVALFISNRPQDLVAFLGLWLARCIVAPIHVATPKEAAQRLIARLGARFVIRAGKLEKIGSAAPAARPLLEGAALIVFTSGSTGQPKGVVVRHEGLVWKLQVLCRLLALRLMTLSSFHCSLPSSSASGLAFSAWCAVHAFCLRRSFPLQRSPPAEPRCCRPFRPCCGHCPQTRTSTHPSSGPY